VGAGVINTRHPRQEFLMARAKFPAVRMGACEYFVAGKCQTLAIAQTASHQSETYHLLIKMSKLSRWHWLMTGLRKGGLLWGGHEMVPPATGCQMLNASPPPLVTHPSILQHASSCWLIPFHLFPIVMLFFTRCHCIQPSSIHLSVHQSTLSQSDSEWLEEPSA